MSKNILITGGAGFIGSNFIEYFCGKYPHYRMINLDKLTYAGNLDNLSECERFSNYKFIQGDICDKYFIADILKSNAITDIIHFAAETHVDNSIETPQRFMETNILGTFTLIDNFRKYCTGRFHHISTDEVYGSLGDTGFFTEETAYAPNSPYSASKASSDMIVRSYFRTYGVDIVVSNCSNNYGPRQHSEKFIPTVIRSALEEKAIPVYGSGRNIRDWLYVGDHCKAIDLVFHSGATGNSYSIGGQNEYTNIDIARLICKILDKKRPRKNGHNYEKLIVFVKDRLGHDFRYAIDSTKLRTELKWRPENTFDSGIIKTIDWYLNKFMNNHKQ